MEFASIVKAFLILLPGLCVAALGRIAPYRGVAWTIVAGLTLYYLLLLSIPLALGHLGILFARQ